MTWSPIVLGCLSPQKETFFSVFFLLRNKLGGQEKRKREKYNFCLVHFLSKQTQEIILMQNTQDVLTCNASALYIHPIFGNSHSLTFSSFLASEQTAKRRKRKKILLTVFSSHCHLFFCYVACLVIRLGRYRNGKLLYQGTSN